jgi:Sec-independent protein translocase protein TatA
MGAELGRGIRDFRKALSEDEGQKEVEKLNMEK